MLSFCWSVTKGKTSLSSCFSLPWITGPHLLSRGEKDPNSTSLSFLTSRRPTKSLIISDLVRFTHARTQGLPALAPYYHEKKVEEEQKGRVYQKEIEGIIIHQHLCTLYTVNPRLHPSFWSFTAQSVVLGNSKRSPSNCSRHPVEREKGGMFVSYNNSIFRLLWLCACSCYTYIHVCYF